jgi:hypothetical protein
MAKSDWHLKSQDQWVFANVERIVMAAVWEECNRILDATYKPLRPQKPSRQSISSLAWLPASAEEDVCPIEQP